MSRLEALAVGKACSARLYSYSRLKKRDPLIALGSHQGGNNLCIRSTPLRGERQKTAENGKRITHNFKYRLITNTIHVSVTSHRHSLSPIRKLERREEMEDTSYGHEVLSKDLAHLL